MELTYLIVDSFCIVFLLILYASIREQSIGLTENRCFCAIVLMTIGTLICDLTAWQLDGRTGITSTVLLWLFNIFCYILSGIITLGWFYYVGIKLNRNGHINKLTWALISLPCFILVVASLSTPWTHLMFSFDENNVYQRGSLFIIQSIIPFGYIFAATFRAGIQATRVRLRQQRHECLYLCSFVVFPLIGGILQICVYGLSLAWPCTALSLMLVYVNLQSQKISIDALTGLNNRGQFDKHLYNCIEHADDSTSFALFMMDIDEFKNINDKYGHIAGDAALISAAGILKSALADSNAFLARYGGDEFAIVLYYRNEEHVYNVHKRIEAEAEAFNNNAGAPPYKLVFSIGYVCSDKHRFNGYQDMLTAADARMYLQKQQHKAVRT